MAHQLEIDGIYIREDTLTVSLRCPDCPGVRMGSTTTDIPDDTGAWARKARDSVQRHHDYNVAHRSD